MEENHIRINYRSLSDPQLIRRLKVTPQGKSDEQALMVLFERYLPLVRSFYTKGYITGMEFDDWKQEAILVMIKVVEIFDSRQARFGRLYKTALRNKICDLLRRQNALRRVPPNQQASFDGDQHAYFDTFADQRGACPERTLLTKEFVQKAIQRCSQFEREILQGIIASLSWEEIALQKHCSRSQVINAFQRCRKKFRREGSF